MALHRATSRVTRLTTRASVQACAQGRLGFQRGAPQRKPLGTPGDRIDDGGMEQAQKQRRTRGAGFASTL